MFLVATLLAVATVKKYGSEEGSEVTELKERSGLGAKPEKSLSTFMSNQKFYHRLILTS